MKEAGYPPTAVARRLAREAASDQASRVVHLWAQSPEYEPLSEDLIINLVALIRSALEPLHIQIAEHQELIRQAKAEAWETAAWSLRQSDLSAEDLANCFMNKAQEARKGSEKCALEKSGGV